MRIAKTALVVLALTLLTGALVLAHDNLTGEEIIEQFKSDMALTGSGHAVLDLITENKRGDRREHGLVLFRSDDGNTEKQLVEYTSPADVRGTKFLSIYDAGKDETEMWLYLPALGRERRIAGHMTKGSFMGTDFTYEEIAGFSSYSDDYEAVRLADEEFDSRKCYVLDLTPTSDDIDYSKVKMWVWQEEMMPLRLDFFNADGQLSKRLLLSDFRQDSQGRYSPYNITMSNQLEGTKTIVIIRETYEEVDDSYFTMRYLRQ